MSLEHVDRQTMTPGLMKITPADGSPPFYATVSMADNPSVAGTPWNKAVMDEFLAASGTTAGTATALTLAQPGYNLFDGALVRVKLHVKSGNAPTLNVNGTTAKPIWHHDSRAAQDLPAGVWFDLIYSSNAGAYIIQGITGIVPTTSGGTGNADGTVARLTNPRTIQTDLSSPAAASFDGTEDITPCVKGILGINFGGTGDIYGTVSGIAGTLNSTGGGTFTLPRPPTAGVMVFINANAVEAVSKGGEWAWTFQFVPIGGAETGLYVYGVNWNPLTTNADATITQRGTARLNGTTLTISNLYGSFGNAKVGILIL